MRFSPFHFFPLALPFVLAFSIAKVIALTAAT